MRLRFSCGIRFCCFVKACSVEDYIVFVCMHLHIFICISFFVCMCMYMSDIYTYHLCIYTDIGIGKQLVQL